MRTSQHRHRWNTYFSGTIVLTIKQYERYYYFVFDKHVLGIVLIKLIHR